MHTSQKLKKSYDHVIIGYNLSSLAFAYELFKKDESFCLLDSKHLNGSGAKFISSVDHLVCTRVPFNGPVDQDVPNLFGQVTTQEGTPLTFDKGQFKSFLGFGDLKIQGKAAVLPYCQTTQTQVQLSPENYWKQALEAVEEFIFLDRQITDITCPELEVTEITLNGQSQLKGQKFYFFDQFSFLFEKLGSKMKKQASQFSKDDWYSSVNLVIHHQEEPETYELDQLYLLMGSKNQPCLGQFSRINGHLVSRWESFIPAELTPDSETTGSAIKEIKKQLKRAFPNSENTLGREHILIHDRIYSPLEKCQVRSGKLADFSNLHIHSPLLQQTTGWIHELLCGLKATEELLSSEGLGVAAPSTPC